jgi:hypothetical protein
MKRMDDYLHHIWEVLTSNIQNQLSHHSDGTWKPFFASITLGITSVLIDVIPMLDGILGIGTRFFQLIIAGCGAFIIIHKVLQLYKQHYSKNKP